MPLEQEKAGPALTSISKPTTKTDAKLQSQGATSKAKKPIRSQAEDLQISGPKNICVQTPAGFALNLSKILYKSIKSSPEYDCINIMQAFVAECNHRLGGRSELDAIMQKIPSLDKSKGKIGVNKQADWLNNISSNTNTLCSFSCKGFLRCLEEGDVSFSDREFASFLHQKGFIVGNGGNSPEQDNFFVALYRNAPKDYVVVHIDTKPLCSRIFRAPDSAPLTHINKLLIQSVNILETVLKLAREQPQMCAIIEEALLRMPDHQRGVYHKFFHLHVNQLSRNQDAARLRALNQKVPAFAADNPTNDLLARAAESSLVGMEAAMMRNLTDKMQ